MLNNKDSVSCRYSDEIVPYLYNESTEAERDRFESHIETCGICTDEFATISNARYSVFEWQKEEFAPMPTPEFVIPYQKRPVAFAGTVQAGGFMAGLRGLLSFAAGPRAIPAFGALIVMAGLAIGGFFYLGHSAEQVAGTKSPIISSDVPPVKDENTASGVKGRNVASVKGQDTDGSKRDVTPQAVNVQKPARVSVPRYAEQASRSPRQYLNGGASDAINTVPKVNRIQKPKALVLAKYDEDDDKSLRLSDLFDEDGSM